MNSLDIYKTVEYLSVFNEINFLINRILIDTRKIKENDIYVGIKGDKYDGNQFFMDAFSAGAKLAILENIEVDDKVKKYLKDNNKSIMIVKSTIKTLGDLAKMRRQMFDKPVVAITGSAGKTSTKDMIYSVLKEKYNAHKTIGNQNNHLGLPLTILGLSSKKDMLVVEMGMNHLGEIDYLTNIAKPDVAVITNVGTAHIGNLGSRENILKAKLEILNGLSKNGLLIINNDNDLLHDWYLNNKDKYNIKTFGIYNESDFMAKDIVMTEEKSTFKFLDKEIEVLVGGEHFIYNALAAISVGTHYGLTIDEIQKGIINFESSQNRMNIINKDDITIIDDCYNANFDSLKYAIKYLGSMMGRNIAVIGTMLELGDYSSKLHTGIGDIVYKEGIDILITVGEYTDLINKRAIELGFNSNNSYHFNSNKEAIIKVKELMKKDDNILIKASYSMNFKEIVDELV